MMQASAIFDLAGETALVTGASSGLGARFARVLAANGARVVLVARRAERLEVVRETIAAAGGTALAITADVLDGDAMRRTFDRAEEAFGPVSVLVNNAGVAQTARALDMTQAEWRRVLALDLDAVFLWAQEGARRMIAAGRAGSIINTASVLGFHVSKGTAAYAVAKAGVLQLTKALALELAGRGVRVNAIAPGWFVTEINEGYLLSERGEVVRDGIPMRRFGEAGDLDGALLLLASRAGSYMTGTSIVVDGGQLVFGG